MITLNRILIVLIIAVLISCGNKEEQATDARPATKVAVQEIKARQRPGALNYHGNIDADNTVSPGFALAGMATDYNDLEGQQALKGQLLATVETQDYAIATQQGIKDGGIIASAVIDEGKGIIEEKKEDENKIFEKVEIEASFKGGESAWGHFLERNLKPVIAVDNGAPAGRYTVYVQFVVSKDGSISDVRALTSHGYGMEAEAVRVIKKGPTWTPAIQNGRSVNAYRKQPITFKVQAE
jgi:TonB family protein